jgi:hypothetical protein
MRDRKYWWVSQGDSFEQARKENYLWAPQGDKRGRAWFYWENVSKVKAGDVIFHYVDGAIRAVSVATADGAPTGRVVREGGYTGKGWRANVEIHELAQPVAIQHIGPRLQALNLEKGPINRNGNASPGYLYELPDDAVESIVEPMSLSGLPKTLVDLLAEWKLASDPADVPLAQIVDAFYRSLSQAGMRATPSLAQRFIASLLAKRFLILGGLSGSGKTQLALAFARWVSPDVGCYAVVAVGADWTSNENIVGYPDRLGGGYVRTPALQLFLRARENPAVPHVLILDEMNLSHVERYFADVLSAIESGEPMSLHSGPGMLDGVPPQIVLPGNLIILGTVNSDETTVAFSPKVLDRANVIEFRASSQAMADFLEQPDLAVDLDTLTEAGRAYGGALVGASNREFIALDEGVRACLNNELKLIFDVLAQHNAEFGFRVVKEMTRFVHFFLQIAQTPDAEALAVALDAQLMQKILPRLNGARGKLGPVVWALSLLCREVRPSFDEMVQQSRAQEGDDPVTAWRTGVPMRYPMSAEKLARLWMALDQNGFVAFMEA